MHILNHLPGQRFAPLDPVSLADVPAGLLTVQDGRGRVYLRQSSSTELTFLAAGATGWQTVRVTDESGAEVARLTFQVQAHTAIQESSGQFSELLDLCYYSMADEPMEHFTRYRGKTYYYFVGWLRDHVHTLKGMKYFEPKLRSGIELYRDSQRGDGMIWDNVHRREPPGMQRNHWGARFYYGDFEHTFEDGTAQFTRIPVENDVEYLFVEGIYHTWKATGDTAWMTACLDAAVRALDYTTNSPYRWSEQYGLLKRGHTIDTWDFQNTEDCLSDFAGWPDPMAVHPDKTRFGIMFGDNTGYAAACGYLAEMLEQSGRRSEAQSYRQRGAEIRERLDQLAWNGRFFTHHVPEDPTLRRDLGVDESTQVSLSNTYSLNRGITQEQCAAILQTYQALQANLPPGSPGEWYLIYPPFPRGYEGHCPEWQYMNGGVSAIAAGELAHGAFEHGFESYGADILRRVLALGNRHGRLLHECYTGAFPPAPQRRFTTLNLLSQATCDPSLRDSPETPTWQRDDRPDLSELPAGRQIFHEIPFDIQAALAVARQPGYAAEIRLPVNARAGSVYLLHTLARGEIAGALVVEYSDGTIQPCYVRSGTDILPINHWAEQTLPSKNQAAIAWRGYHPRHLNLYVTAAGFDTDPNKEIRSLTFKAAEDGALWFVLGVTLCDAPAWFQPNPISYGIPRGWGAAACTYALIEGLAGVVDTDPAFEHSQVVPRWPAAGVEQARVTVHYPASDGYVAYRYEHDTQRSRMHLLVTGSGSQAALRLLLPASAQSVGAVTVDGQPAAWRLETVESSRYVVLDLPIAGAHAVEISLSAGPEGGNNP